MRTILLVIMNSGGCKSIHEIQIKKDIPGQVYIFSAFYLQVCSSV